MPRATMSEKSKLIDNIIQAYIRSEDQLKYVLKEFGVNKGEFLSMLLTCGKMSQYKAAKYAIEATGRTFEEVDPIQADKFNYLQQISEFFYGLEKGLTRKQAAKKVGLEEHMINQIIATDATLQQMQIQALTTRKRNVRAAQLEEELEMLQMANAGRKKLLEKDRVKIKITEKEGTEIYNGKPIPTHVKTTVKEIIDPNPKMIEMTYKMNGLLSKESDMSLDVNVEVIAKTDEHEAKLIIEEAEAEIQRLLAERNEE